MGGEGRSWMSGSRLSSSEEEWGMGGGGEGMPRFFIIFLLVSLLAAFGPMLYAWQYL